MHFFLRTESYLYRTWPYPYLTISHSIRPYLDLVWSSTGTVEYGSVTVRFGFGDKFGERGVCIYFLFKFGFLPGNF